MTVFKSYMQMVKKNLGMVLMYFGIFIGIAIVMSIAGNKGDCWRVFGRKGRYGYC